MNISITNFPVTILFLEPHAALVKSSLLVWMCVKMFGCPSLFSKTPVPTFMKLYILLSYVLVRKPIEFGVN